MSAEWDTGSVDPMSASECRAALADSFDEIATQMVERVVAEAVRASDFFGLTAGRAERYGESVRATFPQALDAMRETDPVQRERKIAGLAASVRAVSVAHHVPRIIERGLVSIAFGVARGPIVDRAARSGLTRDELDTELRRFREALEAKLAPIA
jgi:hypothetical protein